MASSRRTGGLAALLEIARFIKAPQEDRNQVARDWQRQSLRISLGQYGFNNTELQDAVIRCVNEQEEARQDVRSAARRIFAVLKKEQNASEEHVQQLLGEYVAAAQAAKTQRDASIQALDREIKFSSNPRLASALTLHGVVGESSWLTSEVVSDGLAGIGSLSRLES